MSGKTIPKISQNDRAPNGVNFWQQLPTPFLAIAPMADVTDAAFRQMMAKYSRHTRADGSEGGADITWTEFVAADGLVRATPEGKVKLMADLIYSEEERPIIAQLFTPAPGAYGIRSATVSRTRV